MRRLIFTCLMLILFLIQFEAHAQSTPTQGPACLKAEGFSLPKCMFPKFHFCHLPPPGPCKYIKVHKIIKTIADPKHGPCAQGAETCTPVVEQTPEGTITRMSCVCNHYEPNYTECKKTCGFCKPESAVIDSGIKCGGPAGCDPPELCKTPVEINGETYYAFSQNALPACGEAPPNCDVTVPGPSSVDECPDPPRRPDWADTCCYTGAQGTKPPWVTVPYCGPDGKPLPQ